MSTPAGAPRRRRIAGERRPVRPVGREAPADPGAPAPAPPTGTAAATPPQSFREAPPPMDTAVAPPRSDPHGTPGATPPARRGTTRAPTWWGSTPVLAALSLLLVVLVVAVVLGATGHLGNQSVSEAHTTKAEAAAWEEGQSAPATAERAAATILAYDYRSLSATEKEATQFMTSDYAKQYTQTFEKVVVPAARQQKAKVTADVQASSVVRATPDKARVLLFIDQTTVSAANQSPQVALNRVEMLMERRSGSWLVASISSY